MSIKDAAWQVMAEAYHTASGGGRLPANARQIMYAARKRILELTGRTKLDDRYFTQTLLPDYVEQHPAATSTWDVVFDDRGNFIEPHTDRTVPLGTVEVRQYLGERPTPKVPVALNSGSLSPTTGPENRYSAVLSLRKRGSTRCGASADCRAVRHRHHVHQGHVHHGRTPVAGSPCPSYRQGARRARLRRVGLQHLRHARFRRPPLSFLQ